MTRITVQSTTGSDGILRLDVPLEPNVCDDIELVLRPMTKGVTLPAGYFDLIGSIDDDTFFVQPQPPAPPPVDLE